MEGYGFSFTLARFISPLSAEMTGAYVARGKWIRGKLPRQLRPNCYHPRHQVGLELVQIHVERTVETKRRGDRRDDLGDESIQVGVRRSGNAEISSTDIIDPARQFVLYRRTYASLSTMKEQSECSSVVWVVSTELYGSTTEVDIFGAG